MASTLANESRSVRHKQPTSTPLQADAYKQDMTQLVEQYLPLVKSHVSKIRPFFPETTATEDLYSLALKGLIIAINQYKSDKNTTLGGYASIRILPGTLLDELRKIDPMSRGARAKAKNSVAPWRISSLILDVLQAKRRFVQNWKCLHRNMPSF